MAKSRQNSNVANRLTVANRAELLQKVGTRVGEMIYQADIDLTYTWKDTNGTNNGGTDIDVGTGSWYHEVTGAVNVKWFGVNEVRTDNEVPINAMLQLGFISIYIPLGTYYISKEISVSNKNVSIFSNGATIKASTGFSETTLNNYSSLALIRFHKASGNWNDSTWREGGVVSGINLDGNNVSSISGILSYNVCNNSTFENIFITNCNVGFDGPHFGWGTRFTNITIHNAVSYGFKLRTAYNGCKFSGCQLYGKDVITDKLLSIKFDCYGNSFTGGYIEKCNTGVELTNAQLSFSGVDFEVNSNYFIYAEGIYDGASLSLAGPMSSVSGCTFVGAPSLYGIYAKGSSISVNNNFFINSDTLASQYCFGGTNAVDAISGYSQEFNISELNNSFRGWGDRIGDDNTKNRISNIRTSSIDYKNGLSASSNQIKEVDGTITAIGSNYVYEKKINGILTINIKVDVAAGGSTITFPQSFKDTSYIVTATCVGNYYTDIHSPLVSISGSDAVSIYLRDSSNVRVAGAAMIQAIGKWK